LARAAKRGIGDDGGGHLHIGIGQHNHRILGAALALGAFAIRRRPAIDVFGDRRRADEGDRAYQRMVQQRVHRLAATVDHADDALW
jgi:hypothetical protein